MAQWRLRLADIVDCNQKRNSHPAYAASTVFLLPNLEDILPSMRALAINPLKYLSVR